MIQTSCEIDVITPMYHDYLAYMRRFYMIYDYPAWAEAAVRNLARYATEPGYHMVLARSPAAVIGFALVNRHRRFHEQGFALGEFYIQPSYQGKGQGRRLALTTFSLFPGDWEVAVAEKNTGARRFWNRILEEYTQGQFREHVRPSFSGSGFLFNNAGPCPDSKR